MRAFRPFTVVAGLHGRLGEAYYSHEMAYAFLTSFKITNTAHRKLGMVMSAVLLPRQAIDSITALYSAFGVSSRAGKVPELTSKTFASGLKKQGSGRRFVGAT